MGLALTPAERRLSVLLALVTVAGSLGHIARDLAPAPPPIEILRPGLDPDPADSSLLHGSVSPPVFPLDVTTADSAALETLPGIGPVTAQRIIDYRLANGPFTQIEEIMDVSGIGPATFEGIKDLIATE